MMTNSVFQINSNGIISMGVSYSTYRIKPFPVDCRYLVAPFWADVDIEKGVGNISYQVYSTGSPLLDIVNIIISDEENINFIGHWMLVAEWDSVSEYFESTNKVAMPKQNLHNQTILKWGHLNYRTHAYYHCPICLLIRTLQSISGE